MKAFKLPIYVLAFVGYTVLVARYFHGQGKEQGIKEGFATGVDYGTGEIQRLFNYEPPRAESIEDVERIITERNEGESSN